MPTYVYECKTCEKVYEVDQRIVENALTECNCDRKQPVRRLIQPVGIAFKGEGFHINDYAPKAASTPTTTKPSADAAPSGGDATTTSAPVETAASPAAPAPATETPSSAKAAD